MPDEVRGGSVTRSGTPCSRSRAVQDVQEEGFLPACPLRQNLSDVLQQVRDPSPNESDSWSLSHGEVRTQILAPSAAALDSGRVHGANLPSEGFPPPSLKDAV